MGRDFWADRPSASRLVCGWCLLMLVFSAGSLIAAEPHPREVEAIEVLKKFSGDWRTQTSIRHTGRPPREFNTVGQAACRQTLDGRYFEFRAETIPPEQADLQIMTFDVEAGVYRQWVFSSDGYRHEAEGDWNPASS